ncbi:EAL domain-containing protein [Kineosporia mesophila]|uniref:EAL domain-containing protein n=1 Tax=Kineosporia mesophila TaxID=566012 RepID=UPI0031EBB9D5
MVEDAVTLDAALHRIADAGPTSAEVLEELVRDAGLLMDAPTRIASVVDDRLIWTAAYGDDSVELGSEVLLENTACGAAWGTALIQHVAAIDPESDSATGGSELNTGCCGSAAAVLAVPLLRAAPAGSGRHASVTREVLAVLAFTADRPGWFTDEDIEATADLAEVAGERIATLEEEDESPVARRAAESETAGPRTRLESWLADRQQAGAAVGRPSGAAVPEPADEGFDRWFTPNVPVASYETENPAASAVFVALAAAEEPAPERPVPSPDGRPEYQHDPFGLFTPQPREYQAEFTSDPVADQNAERDQVSALDQFFGPTAFEREDAPGRSVPTAGTFDWSDGQSLDEALNPEDEDEAPAGSTLGESAGSATEITPSGALEVMSGPMGERRARRERDRAARVDDEEFIGQSEAGCPVGAAWPAEGADRRVAESVQPVDVGRHDAPEAERPVVSESQSESQEQSSIGQWVEAPRRSMARRAAEGRQQRESQQSSGTGQQSDTGSWMSADGQSEAGQQVEPDAAATGSVSRVGQTGSFSPVAQASSSDYLTSTGTGQFEAVGIDTGSLVAETTETTEFTETGTEALEAEDDEAPDEIWVRDQALDLDTGTAGNGEPGWAGQNTGRNIAPTAMHARLAEMRGTPRVVNRVNGSPELRQDLGLELLTPPHGSQIPATTGGRANGPAFFGGSLPVDDRRVPGARNRGERPPSGSALSISMPSADSMGLWQWDAVTNAVAWSSPVARLLGMPADVELDLGTIRSVLAGADRGRFDVAVQAIVSGRGVAGALRLRTRDGQAKHAYAWSEVRRDDEGNLLGAWGGVVDITAFERDADVLRSGLAGLRAAQELAGLATWEWRPETAELIWSDEMYRLVGVPAENFDPDLDRWQAFVHPDDLDRARRVDVDLDPQGSEDECVETFRLIGTGGEIRHVQSWATPGRAPDGTITAVYGATIDVTRQVRDRIELERVAATDPVTGLGNRASYERRLQLLLRATGPTPGAAENALSVVLLDLDRFKVVNDSLGHETGDRLLIEVARRLVAVVPDGSLIARMSGDEFVVVVPAGWSQARVVGLAQTMLEALRAPYVLPGSGEVLICPGSAGIASNRGRPGSTGADLLREADIALHQAKDAGRDGYAVFDEALREGVRERRRTEQRLRMALADRGLMLEYQPIINLSTNRIIGAEALVRLQDPQGGEQLLEPGKFLDIAEKTGLIVDVDTWVINEVIAQLRSWSENAEDLRAADARIGDQTGRGQVTPPWLAINLSARSTEHPGLAFHLIDAVRRGDFGPEKLKVELTEQAFANVDPAVDSALKELISAGIGVGIDDFGSGRSGLAGLQRYSFDFMKIDRSFVTPVGEDSRADAVVTAIVDLAHAHGMRVIAEGVESGRQARRLREIGCDYAQGYHFGRPGDVSRIIRG